MRQEVVVVQESRVEEKKVVQAVKKEFALEDLPGVGVSTAEKLREGGYRDLISVAVATVGAIVELTGVGEAVARKIIQAARDKLEMGFESGLDLMRQREQIGRVSTGSSAVDKLFGGGVETGGITECYGPYGAGKSALAHQLAVNVQLPKERGGLNGAVVWIDSERTFRPERVKQIAQAQGLDVLRVLQNIRVAQAFNSDHQMLLVEKVGELIAKQSVPVKLVIIDSLMSHFRADFHGRGMLADRQQKLNRHIHDLLKLASTQNVVVYVTNQVMARPDVFFGDPTEAVGGHVVAHGMTTRVYLRKGKKGTRVAKMVDSPYLAEGEAAFRIVEEGIRDVE